MKMTLVTRHRALPLTVLALAAVLGLGAAAPASAITITCYTTELSASGFDTGGAPVRGAQLTVYYGKCTDGTFKIGEIKYSTGPFTRYVKPVIIRYGPDWGPTVVSWQGAQAMLPGGGQETSWYPGEVYLGYSIAQSLHPYVYVAYSSSSGGPWTASPVIRLS